MARNSGGTYSLPAGQPVVTGTVISSATHNTLASDIATELTDSLNRSGKGAMLAPLELTDGTAAAPSLTFDSDVDTGFYRAGANEGGASAGGTRVAGWSATGWLANVLQAMTATSATIKGAIADGASAVGVIIDNTIALANAGAKIASFRTNAVEKLAVDKDGAVLGPAAGALLALKGTTANGGTAVGVAIDTTNAFSTAGSKIASFRTNAVEAASVAYDGSYATTLGTVNAGGGIIGSGGGVAGTAAGGRFTAGGLSPTRGAVTLVPQAAPSGPQDGDIWVETGTNTLKVRINGVTKTVTVT